MLLGIPSGWSVLTEVQIRFAEAYVLNGSNGTEAYLEANPDVSQGSAATQSTRLLKNAEVLKLIEKLRKPRQKRLILTLERKRELLSQFAEDEEAKLPDRIKSIEVDAKLAGEFTEKVEHTINCTPEVQAAMRAMFSR